MLTPVQRPSSAVTTSLEASNAFYSTAFAPFFTLSPVSKLPSLVLKRHIGVSKDAGNLDTPLYPKKQPKPKISTVVPVLKDKTCAMNIPSNLGRPRRKQLVISRDPPLAVPREKPLKRKVYLRSHRLPPSVPSDPLKLYRKSCKKILLLAAHMPSLPKVPSPLSPRARLPPFAHRPAKHRAPCSLLAITGRSNSNLELTKLFWNLRRDAWLDSYPNPPPRSSPNLDTNIFPESEAPDWNFDCFPRAGTLKYRSDEEALVELDWSLRRWSLNKIQRALFMNDLNAEEWFSIPSWQDLDTAEDFQRMQRPWEWCWELKWMILYHMFLEEQACEEYLANADCDELGASSMG